MKSKVSKWILIGVSQEDREKIYQKLRMKAKTILKQKHEKEYLRILKSLIKEEINALKLLKGGNQKI